MITIKQDEFEKLTYKLAASNYKTHLFTCEQNPNFDIQMYEGCDEESGWVHFTDNVYVIADDDTDNNDLLDDDYRLLNIDARPEIIFDYLASMLGEE